MIKVVGTAAYAHRTNVKELMNKKVPLYLQDDFQHFINLLSEIDFHYDILKYDRGNVTLITSPDWDTANEPIVGVCYRFNREKVENITEQNFHSSYKRTNNFRQIYHNKWQFVGEDYKGFDIEKARQRTNLWMTIPDIKEKKKYIGNKNYWETLLLENGIPI